MKLAYFHKTLNSPASISDSSGMVCYAFYILRYFP